MSCSVEYQGQMYIIGGFYNEHRVSVVSDCMLKFHSFLPAGDNMEFFEQKCAVFNSKIWMCAPKHDDTACYSYDGTELIEEASTHSSHLLGGLVSFRQTLVTISGYTTKVEKLDETGTGWTFDENFPDVLNSFTTLVYKDAIYVFG